MELIRPIILIILSLSWVHGGATKCTGFVGFSSIGASLVHSSGLIKFRTNYVDSGHGWVSDTGTFTAHCPGMYGVSFTGYGESKSRIILQKRGITPGAKFESVITTPPGGGSVSILVSMKMGEQLAVGVTGALQTDSPNSVPVTSFNAHKIGD